MSGQTDSRAATGAGPAEEGVMWDLPKTRLAFDAWDPAVSWEPVSVLCDCPIVAPVCANTTVARLYA